jgi:hypothetical protein
MRYDALMLFPESVLVEPLPHRTLFDMQDEFRFALLDLDAIGFDDARDRVPGGSHSRGVQLVFAIYNDDRAGQRPFGLGVQMQLLPHRSGDDFQVFDDRIGFPLVLKRVLLGSIDGVFEHVVETANAGRFSLSNQSRTTASDQDGLHVGSGLVQIEQLATIGLAPHFDQSAFAIKIAVGEGPGGDVEIRIPSFLGNFDDGIGQTLEFGHGFDVFSLDGNFLLFFLGSTSPLCHGCTLPVMSNSPFCTGRVPTCLGRSPLGIVRTLVLLACVGDPMLALGQQEPHPWIASAPPAFTRLIDRGQVQLVVDDARLKAAKKRGLTLFRIRSNYRYQYELKGVQRVSNDPSRLQGDVVVQLNVARLDLEHTVIVGNAFQPPKPWEDLLIQHEFDHVSISTDPRFRKIAKEVLEQPFRFSADWLKAQGLGREKVDEKVKEEVSTRIAELERVVQANYDALDRESQDGQANLRERFVFFQKLYSEPWLRTCEFSYLDSIRVPVQDSAVKDVQEHYLSIASP